MHVYAASEAERTLACNSCAPCKFALPGSQQLGALGLRRKLMLPVLARGEFRYDVPRRSLLHGGCYMVVNTRRYFVAVDLGSH
jgi:hypothetical protein